MGFLDGLTSQIQEEHNQHLAMYTEQRAECQAEFDFRDSEVADAQDSFDRSQTQLNLCASEESRATNLGDLASQALNIYNAQLDDLRTARAAAIALFNQRITSLDNAVVQVNEGINILDEFELSAQGVVPPSFIQVVNSLLAVTVRTGHSHKVLPVYSKLLQSHSKQSFDVTDIEEVRDLLQEILGNLEESHNTVEDQEAADAVAFADAETALLAVISRLNDQVTQSADYASRMDSCVQQEESISLQAQGKIDRNNDLNAQAHTLCDDADAEFQQGESTRRGQLELLGQLRSAVQALEAQYGESLLPNIEELVNLGA